MLVTIWRLELQKSDPLGWKTTGCLYSSHKFPKDNTLTLSTFTALNKLNFSRSKVDTRKSKTLDFDRKKFDIFLVTMCIAYTQE